MSRLTCYLTVLWLAAAATQANILKAIGKGVVKEVGALTDPAIKVAVFIGSSQCSRVKKLVGMSYDAYEGQEPDLSRLTLNFITRSVNITYRLTDAAELIPESKWFKPDKRLVIYLHGFTDNPSKDGYAHISQAFLAQDDCNIVALDASSLIKWLYLRSSTMVHFIGNELGKVLANLVNASLVDRRNIHLIGHSLGSHISGFAGKTFTSLTGQSVGRLTGLDPAGPCFGDVNVTLRLNVNDADFVDVIHTDAGVYGLGEQVGHVDFYPNSGSQQPNCVLQTCSHSRAWQLFAESVINPDAFVGVSCSSWEEFRKGKCDYNNNTLMGFACPEGTTGKYYLQTNEDIPYGRGENGTEFVNNFGIVQNLKYDLVSLG